jgi:hypothetical protein
VDERLAKALEFSNYMITLNNQKRLLKEKYHEDLLYFKNGCQFTVTKELITFVGMLISNGNDSNVILVDDNDIPTNIDDLNSFYDDILDVYFSASNEYHIKYNDLKSKRSVEKLIDHE